MDEDRSTASALYGRDDLVRQIAALKDSMVVISGDSGIGKSAVLAAAAKATTDVVAPLPVVIGNRPGGLQEALLRSCGLALATALEREGAISRAAGTLIEATKRFIATEWRGIGAVIGQEVLALVRGRLGADVGKAIELYAHELRETVDQNLAARIRAVNDADTLNTIIGLTTELAIATTASEFVISLDKGERLSRADQGLLADLGSELPSAIRLRVAFATETFANREGVEYLVGLGATEVPVPALGRQHVAGWLDSHNGRSLTRPSARDGTHSTSPRVLRADS
ncbi:MAG: AAA family ATPase [Acidimicrobiales bacterium]